MADLLEHLIDPKVKGGVATQPDSLTAGSAAQMQLPRSYESSHKAALSSTPKKDRQGIEEDKYSPEPAAENMESTDATPSASPSNDLDITTIENFMAVNGPLRPATNMDQVCHQSHMLNHQP
jgi:hypothetical protein